MAKTRVGFVGCGGIAEAHLAEVGNKIAALQSLRDVLAHLIHACHGDERPDCPILDDLAGESGPSH